MYLNTEELFNHKFHYKYAGDMTCENIKTLGITPKDF